MARLRQEDPFPWRAPCPFEIRATFEAARAWRRRKTYGANFDNWNGNIFRTLLRTRVLCAVVCIFRMWVYSLSPGYCRETNEEKFQGCENGGCLFSSALCVAFFSVWVQMCVFFFIIL